MRKIALAFAAAAGALTVGMAATPASAAVTLLEPGCDIYSSSGCLFSTGGGGEFDDWSLISAAYNTAHAPPPLPTDVDLLGKSDAGFPPSDDQGTTWTFDLPFDVSFAVLKAGSNDILVFGFDPAKDNFTLTNDRLKNNGGQIADISHVTFFSTGDGGLNEVPEPGTWALMITGFGAAGAMLRRRKLAVA